MLGPTLQHMLDTCKGKFTLRTTLRMAIDLLTIISTLHERSIIHRYFLWYYLRDSFPTEIFLPVILLLGSLSDKYFVSTWVWPRDTATRELLNTIPSTISGTPLISKLPSHHSHSSLKGTPRYASIRNHLGHEQSRRDDIESIGYMLIYFAKGRLPWQSIEASSKDKKYKEILAVKERTSTSELCRDLPKAFEDFIKYARGLAFDAEPNMKYLKGLFSRVQREKGFADNASTSWEWE